jgi:hypothetical protein
MKGVLLKLCKIIIRYCVFTKKMHTYVQYHVVYLFSGKVH